jgi:hypothetical protein
MRVNYDIKDIDTAGKGKLRVGKPEHARFEWYQGEV